MSARTDLETAIVEGETSDVGRDPRKMTVAELEAVGHRKRPLLRVIRENCIECAGGSEAEVRRCRISVCPFWPYRMGTNPFHVGRELSEEERAAAAERLQAARRAKNPASR